MESVSYVGMDVHKDTIDMVVMEAESREPVLEKRIGGDMRSIVRFFEKVGARGPVVAGYEAGKVAVPRKAVEAPVAVLAELNPIERRAYTHKALATTQGRVSLTPVIQKGVVEYLSQHSISARAGDPDPDSAVTTKWVMVVWGADDLSDGFNPITAAIHSMCSDVMEFIDGYPDVVVRVAPYHGIADRRFGWTLVASPKERTT